MKRSHKILATIGVCGVLAVSTALLASRINYPSSNRGSVTIVNQGINVDKAKDSKIVTQDSEGHLTFSP